MNKRSLQALEFDKILELLAQYAASEMAKLRCRRIVPQRDINRIITLQEETRDAFLRLEKYGNLGFSGLTDVGAVIKLLSVESVLSTRELLAIAGLLETAAAAKKYGEGEDIGIPKAQDSLTERFDMLVPLADVSSRIRHAIISVDEIADDASSGLKEVRRKLKAADDKLRREIDKLLKNDAIRDMLQDSLVTTRGGRYCLPVKAEARSKFKGMIHDRSASGSTLFIEPESVVNINNEITELTVDEHAEIEKVLSDLSLMAAAVKDDIEFDFKTLIELDFIFAKGKFARAFRCSEPSFNEEGRVDIKAGRHPLLDKKTVVPIDIKIGEGYNLLIVTGPNTGGKTVSLKTLGLFTLMGQAGLHIPADEGSSLSVYSDVFADIGDEQSIEMSLSTFSSHMSNIVYIVKHVDRKTLCLFDELGGGTDPVEGAALATSILDYLKQMGATVMATTHYNELKVYAMSEEGVENASCEFDVATLTPTYKLRIGIPGSSNAFAISSKLGLPKHIIDAAGLRMEQADKDMEKLITGLTESRRRAEEDEQETARLKAEAEELKKSLAEKESELSSKKADILEKAREEARDLIDAAKTEADNAIKEYNKWLKNPNRADIKAMEEKRSGLRQKLDKLDASAKEKPKQTSNHKSSDFHIGDMVLALNMGTKGTVSSLPDAKGYLTVRLGIINTKLHMSEVSIIEEPKKESKAARTVSSSVRSKALTISPEINVIGKTVDEARAMLDKYLDDAALSNMSQVTIIHGKGTGALRKGIHEYLKRNPVVASFRSGEYGEGEYGVTVVNL